MKRILILIFGIAVAGVAYAQTATTAKVNGPVLTWEKATHDFGDIQPGDKVEHIYKFTNTGNEPLIITDIKVTCGCTQPKWSRDPVLAGGKSEVVIGFNSLGKSGRQDKVITIISNAVNPEGNTIKFTTNIVEKKTVQ